MNPMSAPELVQYFGEHPAEVQSLSPIMRAVVHALQAESTAQSPKKPAVEKTAGRNHKRGPL